MYLLISLLIVNNQNIATSAAKASGVYFYLVETNSMSNELQIYKFAPDMNLRTAVIDGEPWYIAEDVCASLGFRDAFNTLLQTISSLLWPIPCASTVRITFRL